MNAPPPTPPRASPWFENLGPAVVVTLISVPLSMGIAIASGVPAARGLVTGIVGGLLIGSLTSCRLQISGPSAGQAVMVLELVNQFGVRSLGVVVPLVGLLQTLAGFLKLGKVFRAVSPAVINGMLAGIGLLLFNNADYGMALLWLVLLPGILLHEGSHWITAKVLGLKTGKFSFTPNTVKGQIVLGSVEVQRSNAFKDSLVGLAPFLAGTLALLILGYAVFDVGALGRAWEDNAWQRMFNLLVGTLRVDDAFLWLYLVFAISNAMLPSKSDRRAWPAFIILMVVLAVVLYFLGLTDELMQGLKRPAATVFGYLGIALSVAIGANLFFMFCMVVVEWGIGRLKGISVVYGASGASKSS